MKLSALHSVAAVLSITGILFFGVPVPSLACGSLKPEKEVVINVPSRTLTLYVNNKPQKTYPVAVGRKDYRTPVGIFHILRKVKNPEWENPYKAPGEQWIKAGQDNPLGTRWIGFHRENGGEFGIHGTDQPKSVGQFSSHGCVRMKITDAEELFNSVDVGTQVRVTYHREKFERKGNRLYISLYPDVYERGVPHRDVLKERILDHYPQMKVSDKALLQTLQEKSQPIVLIGEF